MHVVCYSFLDNGLNRPLNSKDVHSPMYSVLGDSTFVSQMHTMFFRQRFNFIIYISGVFLWTSWPKYFGDIDLHVTRLLVKSKYLQRAVCSCGLEEMGIISL
jgi:cytochrome b subunit of formate dehydrogenase